MCIEIPLDREQLASSDPEVSRLLESDPAPDVLYLQPVLDDHDPLPYGMRVKLASFFYHS